MLEREFESRFSHTNCAFSSPKNILVPGKTINNLARQVENDKFVSTQIRLHGRRGKGKTESFCAIKIKTSIAKGRVELGRGRLIRDSKTQLVYKRSQGNIKKLNPIRVKPETYSCTPIYHLFHHLSA